MSRLWFLLLILALSSVLFESEARRGRGRGRGPGRGRGRERGPARGRGAPDRLSRKLVAFSRAANDFGVSLYKELAPAHDNLVLAPVSVFTAMSMVLVGARANTASEMFTGLKLQSFQNLRKVNKAFKRYTASVTGAMQNVSFDTANAVYMMPGRNVIRNYIRKLRTYYKSQVSHFNLSHPVGPEEPINEWIEMKTRGMIQDFLQPGSINALSVLWLINAVYFKGTWAEIFDERSTRPGPFHTGGGQQVQVDMMYMDYQFASKHNTQLRVRSLELPYAGGRFSFFILLPDEMDGLQALESSLNFQVLEDLVTGMSPPSRFELKIPKLRLESTLDLVSSLQGLGIAEVFVGGQADLSGIRRANDLFVDKVKQKAILEVNERGTTAAAVTGIRASVTSLPPQFRADHPFMYVLRDKATGTNVFIGRVSNPETE